MIKKLNHNSCFLPETVFNNLLKTIATALRERMSKRALWTSPTNYLGYPSAGNWNQDASLFEEIVFDCYVFAIAKRFRSLRNAMQRFDNIDGLVFRNINNFLTERQRTYDPIGYAVAQNIICALEAAVELGAIIADNLNRKICNRTSFSFESSQMTDDPQLISKVLRNNQTWLKIRFKLVKRNKRVQQQLCEMICAFKEAGIKCFKFKTLVDIMKNDVRASYLSLKIDNPQEEFHIDCNELNRIFKLWYLNILGMIEQANHQRRVRHHLKLIFISRVKAITQFNGVVPSQSELAKQLNVSIGTINADIKILRKYAQLVTNDYKSNSLSLFIDKILK